MILSTEYIWKVRITIPYLHKILFFLAIIQGISLNYVHWWEKECEHFYLTIKLFLSIQFTKHFLK